MFSIPLVDMYLDLNRGHPYPSSYCQAQILGEDNVGPANHGATLILLLDHTSQASRNLHQTYPSFVMEDAEDQTSAGFGWRMPGTKHMGM